MRNRYLDLLRAVATVRVVVYHLTGWAALTVIFPAMSVMFALAGSLMAASIDRFGVWSVERRLRRLLPSLWVLGLVIAVPAMLIAGTPFDVHLLLWGFPLVDPEATGWWMQSLSHAWYLRDFLWFVLLSPLALPVFRRFPLASVLTPYLVLVFLEFSGFVFPAVARDLALYGGAWLLGFAHHDGHLRRLSRKRLFTLAAALAIPGAAWVITHPGPRGYDLNDIPLGNALWSAAFILVALGVAPMVREHRALTVLNARALTIYLWHIPIIVAVNQVGQAHGLPLSGWVGISWRAVVVVMLLGVVLAAVGWVEDVAAGRRPQLVPGRKRLPVPVSPAPASVSPGAYEEVAASRA
ncbi:peptidoglycan/LPS O-acetylase OafA/YrhL [Actinoplanes lutulentus]|uniref:Peptidoglycan/LPS O-acetylase OafA/YrhL n=1 Tax=Actinoplanes lutulentus TaxID=1287878 RepID=A0A327ZMM2_9ACTN|nr:acyltransferase family protein [Actinoplanes lutulentus]MBB2942009.1 peptidoglycan/LPS O-acetylase OafA/YrhL [Actinoplanes lutulentus]RAK39921.1 peptidoglycan/LPS O-acetylase OafA/YrhL [Actinoplanes lutulentus]